ncbi:SirB1 family protein [Oxalobacteraceae bacterium R-40]|uniref:SirB1 family protein n=1 Tax=Keguizhuia sedimenti TaxID=3064264 RepID=A0ABU1BP71_9BURK|nr:SirB1 family protein [Oxalobacteraceae bacterium R-40]
MTLASLDYFSALVSQDDSIPLFEAALCIAQDAEPELDLSMPQIQIDVLAERLKRRLSDDASDIQKLRLLNHFFYFELGFGGNINDYYHPDNSYIHRVIATRRGIPISLAVVYMELAQQIGLDVKGISFPGHFLMKLSVQSGEIILDPFNGASLSREELEQRLEPYLFQHDAINSIPLGAYLQTAQPREILVRMLRNLKSLFVENGDWHRLLEVQQRLHVLLPDDIIELRDRGLAYARLECPQPALMDLEAYLSQRPYAPDSEEIRRTVSEMRIAIKKIN